MNKRILSLLMAACLLYILGLPVSATEIQPSSQESTATTVEAEVQPTSTLEPQEAQAEVNAILLEDMLSLDMEQQYPGMDKVYQAGYAGTVTGGRLHLVIPLLNTGTISGSIDVTLSAAFLTADEKKEAVPSQNVDLGNGQSVQNVFLADFEVALPATAQPGSYPVTVKVESAEYTQPMVFSLPQNIVIPVEDNTTEDPTPTESQPEDSEPTVPTEPSVPQIPTVLEIDSAHIYSGMDMAYEDGYLPRITDGVMRVVLPLRCSGSLWDNKLEASVSLDTSASSPFVVENLRKSFYLQSVVPKNSSEAQEIYLVSFDIPLTDSRKNGTYPVTINTSSFDLSGNAVATSFTLYITITDGVVEKVAQPVVETATAEPVVYISKTILEPDMAQAGETFTMTVTLKNSITTKSVKNMLVTVDTGSVQIDLEEDSNIFPVSEIPRGGEVELTLHFSTAPAIPSGKYPINFSFKYDSSKTLNLSSSGSTVVEIQQPANMELVMPRFAASVSVGETVPVSFQVMNMGRSAMYNVRCIVSGYGLIPSNTGYIGTMQAGTSDTTEVELYIVALNTSSGNENGPQYGDTVGTVTLIYEDETGQEYQQEMQFETTVSRPVVEVPQTISEEEAEEKAASQWWISVLILGGVLIATGFVYLLIKRKKKNRGGVYL